MSVTTTEFEAMAPTPYSQAREGLRTGDILLFHSHNFPDDAIEWATHSLWCHAAFIWRLAEVDRVMLLESVDKFGVRAMPLSTRINGSAAAPKPYPGKLLVLRHKDFPAEPNGEKIGAMTAFALDRLGYPYSPAELVKIAERIAAGLAGVTLPGRLEPKNGFICSEYVAKCYEALGIALAPDREGFIAPADIANDPNMTAVYSLVPDPAPEEAQAEAQAEAKPEAPEPEPELAVPADPEPQPAVLAHTDAAPAEPPLAIPAPPPAEPEPRAWSAGNWALLTLAAGLAAAAGWLALGR